VKIEKQETKATPTVKASKRKREARKENKIIQPKQPKKIKTK
jgi:hypothetical protein